MEDQLHSKKELASLSVKDIFFKYLRFLPLFILAIAASLFVSYIYLRYATLIYSSTGTMVIKDEKSSGGSNDKFEQLLMSDGKKNIQNEIEYLKSRPLMERVVRALNLNFTYYAKGNIKELNIYTSAPFVLQAYKIKDSAASFSMAIDFENEKNFRINKGKSLFTFGQVFETSSGIFSVTRNPLHAVGSEYRVAWEPTSNVASQLISSLLVAPKQNTGILILSLESTNPALAANVINQLMLEYQLATIEDKNVATRNTLKFVDERIAVVQRELDSINLQLQLFQQQNNIIEPETQSSNYLSRIEETNKEASVQAIMLTNAQMIEDYLNDQNNAFTPVPSVLGISDPTLTEMIGGYNKSQLDRVRLLENAPPGNIAIQQVEQQIHVLRSKILENVKNIKASVRSTIGSIENRERAAIGQVRLLPAKMQVYSEIQRAQATKLVVYNSLLEKREQSAISLASTISNTKVLQDARPNQNPISPDSKNAKLLAIVIGLALPALFIFVLELLNDKINGRADIEKLTNATILGEVGHNYGKEALVVTQTNRKVVSEQFRILRSNLQYVLNHVNKPVILVTSSFSGEGKSFISANMGAVMAVTGKKTIILEFDIRKPKVLSHLNLPKKPGLTNYILGKVKPEDLPIPVPGSENLFVLACGPVPPNPAELLLDPKLDELITYLKANFDVIVMDTAPVGMVSDAMILSRFADCTLYITRQGHTFKKQVGLIDELYQQGKLPKINIILNDVTIKSGYGYYGSGKYGYGYGYGYGSGYFEDEDIPKNGMSRWLGWMGLGKKKKRKTSKV